MPKPLQNLYINKASSSDCDGAGARHLVKGSLKTLHMYIDVASPPSLVPHLDIFVIQHSFQASRCIRSSFGSEAFVRARGICSEPAVIRTGFSSALRRSACFNIAIISQLNVIDREAKELLPYSIFIITRHYKRVEIRQ